MPSTSPPTAQEVLVAETTLDEVVEELTTLYDVMNDCLQAIRENTEAVNRWGTEIEDRLSHIEGNTMD
jgi:hypothetical protein